MKAVMKEVVMVILMGADLTCKECALDNCEYCGGWAIQGLVRCACYESDPEGHIRAWEGLMGLADI